MSIFTRTREDVFESPTAHLGDISGDYTIDTAHTRLGFSARHAMVTTVRGEFRDFSGSAHVDTEDPARSSVKLTIDANSIDTGNPQRNGHLLSGDFFETEAFPEITFSSTDVSRDGQEWSITGDLTIKGISKPVTVVFEETGSAKDPFGNDRIGFEGVATLNRKDWGLSWNAALETGGVLVGDEVTISLEIEAIQQEAADAPAARAA